ncbi:TRAP transporter large permease [Ornithinimicrobium cavernae]|uniref:TRAP transporter large permease n=1 Tax=Ornithinimicrobium cavernae TaxID=2666047 RepID=UPI000D687C08|nr:TRAP transporter large permease [Ornithinimicrobium cavernae]
MTFLEPSVVVLLGVLLLVALILAERPIWLALLAAGAVGVYLLRGSDISLSSLGSLPYSATASYSLFIIPMFVLMGIVASKAGLAGDVYAVAQQATKKLPGGLGIATILACGGFAAVTGSSVATVATIGRIAIKEMTDHGYKPNAAASIVAVGGTLGVLIPPSVILVVYGILTGESIGQLLMAGVIPGIVSIVFYSIGILLMHRGGHLMETEGTSSPVPQKVVQHSGGPGAATSVSAQATPAAVGSTPATAGSPREGTGRPAVGMPVRRENYVGTLYVLALLGIIIVGLYTGLFTATESGAIAAFVAVLVMAVRLRRRPRQMFASFREALSETASLSSMIFLLLVGGSVFAYFLVSSGIPIKVAAQVANAGMHPILVVVLVLLFMIVLGCFLDSLSILVITIPLTYPMLMELGVDGIWFAILVVKAIEIGLITPPVGLNVFVVAGTHEGLTPEGVFRTVWRLGLMDAVVIAVLILCPFLVTWLPYAMYG